MTHKSPQLDSLFLAALDIEFVEQRAAFLESACGGDAELRGQVERLLQSHQEAGSFLEQPPPEYEATIHFDSSNPDRAGALEAGFAATFPKDQALLIGHAGHSVLKNLRQTMELPGVALRDSADQGHDPIVRPRSAEMSDRSSDSRYQLQGEIARGGMGAILKGRDTDLGRDLAIKVLLDAHKDKPEVVQRFIEEAQIGGQLQHPGIAPVYELGQFADRRPFFSMKLVKGETLSKLLADRKEAAEERGKFLGIFQQICQTMAYAHNRGVIHRDLKPANIMVGAFGEVQVMDWGLAKVLPSGGVADERKSLSQQQGQSLIQTLRSKVGSDFPGEVGTVGSQTQMGSVMGTPAYMPPEQALGEIDLLDERADVFGLGAILCEILTGKPPYVADDGTQVFRLASRGKLADCFQRLDNCGADADLIILAKECLELEPQARPRNASVLAERIAGYLESVETKLRATELAKVDAQARAEELHRRRKLLYALATLLLVGLIGTGFAASHFRSLEHTQRNLAISNQQLASERETQRNAAVAAREEAKRERDIAQQAQRDAIDQTYLARLSEVRALRLARPAGWRSTALERLRELALLESRNLDRVELRSEALSCLAELDVRLEPRMADLNDVIWRFQYSPDGRALAIPDYRAPGSPVVVHDLVEKRDLVSVPRAGLFAPFAFHPNGALAVAASPGRVTWHPVRPEQPTFPEIAGDGDALNMAFSGSGARLAIAWGKIHPMNPEHASEFRQVTVHDSSTGKLLWTLKTPADTPGGYKIPLGLSPDGKTLVISGPNAQVLLYAVGSAEEPTVLGKVDVRICTFAFRPDGQMLAVAGRLTGAVWNLSDRSERFRMHAPEGGFWDITYSPDGQLLAGALNDSTIRLWDAGTGRELAVRPSDTRYPCLALSFSPHGDRIAAGNGTPNIFQIEGRWECRTDTHESNVLCGLAFDATRQSLLAIGAGGLLDWRLDRPTADVVDTFRLSDAPQVLRLAPNGRCFAIGNSRWLSSVPNEYSVSVHSLDGSIPERRLYGPQERVFDLAFAPSGKRLAGASEDGRLYLWEFDTGTLEYSVELPARAVQFLDENELIVAVGERVVVLAAKDGSIVREASIPGGVAGFGITPDRSLALVATNDGSVHRLQLAEMTVESSRMVLEKPSNLLMAMSPDGALLVIATNAESRIRLIDAHSLETLARLPAKDKNMRYLEFDSNGRYFALGGGVVTLWDLALVRGELLRIGLDFHESTTEQYVDLFCDLVRRASRRGEKSRIIATAAPLPGVLEVLAERANDDVPFLSELARFFTQKGDLPRADAARKQALILLEDRLAKEPGNEAAEEELVELLLIDPSTDLNGVLERVPAAATRVGDLHLEEQDWQSAIAAYSLVITEETTDVALLQKRAEAYAATGQWESAAADWLRIVELRPDQLLQAFKLFLKAERWTEASRFALQLARLSPPTASEQWMPLAVVQVLARDRDGYVEVCEGMRETFAASEIAIHAERTVKICLLWPEAFDPASLPSDKFIRELDDGTAPEGYKPWYWTARAILALRSKDAESAATYVANSEANAPSENCHVLNLTLLAQAEHERNRHAEASKTLEQASQLLARFREFPSAKGDHDLLIAEILFREAGAKINR